MEKHRRILIADDYLPKPFSNIELLMRIRAVLKRSYPEDTPGAKIEPKEKNIIKIQDIILDKNSRSIRKDGKREKDLILRQKNKVREKSKLTENYQIGITSIQRIAYHYQGEVKINSEEDNFEIEIVFS